MEDAVPILTSFADAAALDRLLAELHTPAEINAALLRSIPLSRAQVEREKQAALLRRARELGIDVENL